MNHSIHLKKGKEESLLRGHPWVFSGAISKMSPGISPGEWTDVWSAEKKFLGCGHYSDGSIAVRMLSKNMVSDRASFYTERLQQAIQYRKNVGIFSLPDTTIRRLVFGEGDQLPGLVIDQYADTLVIQAHSEGMFLDLPHIVTALQQVEGISFDAIYNKSSDSLHSKIFSSENAYLFGERSVTEVKEYGNIFKIDWESGQKTGFFIDQRENRKLAGTYANGKKVLNAFCYTGGFSVYALNGGAREVHSIDISAKAMQLTDENAARSNHPDLHISHTADVFDFLKSMDDDFDVVILDPPAFAKSRHTTHNAVQGYKRINAMAMQKMQPGALLFTFSCSQNISAKLFEDTIRAAAIEVGRPCRILHRLTQPPDHPVNIFHPESEYLKGLVLSID
jgi:23S rRNA (cytosine1962-C5)-methyltransferase